jgi:hypothetical protein
MQKKRNLMHSLVSPVLDKFAVLLEELFSSDSILPNFEIESAAVARILHGFKI